MRVQVQSTPQTLAGADLDLPYEAESHTALTVSTARGATELDALESDWRSLFDRSGTRNYFASYDWCKSWWDALGSKSGTQPVVIGVRRGKELLALLPLVVRRAGLVRSASSMAAETGQYGDILLAPGLAPVEHIFRLLWDGIVGSGIDVIDFKKVRTDSPLFAFLAPRRRILGSEVFTHRLDTSKYENFEAYWKSRSASMRKNLRRARRKLEGVGKVTYEVIRDPDLLPAAFRQVIEHKHDWLRARGLRSDFLMKPEIFDWMSDVALKALQSGNLHLSVVRVDGQIISSQCAFICKDRFTAYMSTFDLDYSVYAAGKIQYQSFFEDVFDQGLTIDLMPYHEHFKRDWVDLGVATYSCTVPVSRLGRLISTVANPRNRDLIKGLYWRLPEGIRNFIATPRSYQILRKRKDASDAQD